MSFKPNGYPSVSPYLLVRDAQKTMQFLESVFGAKPERVFNGEDGKTIAHAEARLDDSVIMMGQTPEAMPSHVHVYRPDVDDCFARAEAAGGEVVQPLKQRPDGDYRGGVSDPNGIVWWISEQRG